MIDSDTKTCHPKRKTRSIIIFKAEIEKKKWYKYYQCFKIKEHCIPFQDDVHVHCRII